MRIGQLKAEPRNDKETKRLLATARTRLRDASLTSLSAEGRFTSDYNAAHAAALSALRWHGYRSENRYIVFQCLTQTLNWTAPQWRVLDAAHKQRNLAEYEGFIEVEEATIAELCAITARLVDGVAALIET